MSTAGFSEYYDIDVGGARMALNLARVAKIIPTLGRTYCIRDNRTDEECNEA